MRSEEVKVTYVGGPTALLEFAGLRFLTDPTFDAAGTEYKLTTYTLRKTQAPAIEPELIPDIDAVLLSHDHHFDNLDHSGRRFLTRVPRILTTSAGALRLGGNCIGLANWHSVDIPTRDGRVYV